MSAGSAHELALTTASEWLVASGLDGLPDAFVGMLLPGIPDPCATNPTPSAGELRARLRDRIAGSIPSGLPGEVAGWLTSETAARVRTAEQSLATLDEAGYERVRDAHLAALSDDRRRVRHVRTIIELTRVATLDTVMFNELAFQERLYAACGDEAALRAVWAEIGEQPATDTLVSFFLGASLPESTLLMFRDLAQADMEAYIAFVTSPAGRRWHGLLVDSVTATLRADRERLFHALLP